MKMKEIIRDGLFANNPVLVQLIGLCSVLAVSASVMSAVGMGMSVLFVLTLSNIVISLLRKFIPSEVRIPAFIVVIASFVTMLQMLLQAFVPALYDALGIFLPLIVVNCIILGRAEAFASKHNVLESAVDGIANAIGYTLAIAVIAVVRELFGSGTIFGISILPGDYTIPFMTQPAAAFIVLGSFIALVTTYKSAKQRKMQTPHCADKTLEGAK